MRQDGIIWERGVGPLGYDGSSGTLSGFGIAEVDDAHGGQGGGFPPLCYGEDGGQEGHSLRTGGATAARKLEVLGAYIKAQGDWKSDCFERGRERLHEGTACPGGTLLKESREALLDGEHSAEGVQN
ncbi:hypothetical protein CYMTET_4713 [Cymbomonas tetramitiformis]|uniref:Uncharacterized protein n=1 Tax=Cymbomonas tetramitiformis TaxID=36881 RepID=A0AAE0LJM1_9CHLO|nr:hypothetical protein CYMTET_4713 [Cymbomonas tetramitiformis]